MERKKSETKWYKSMGVWFILQVATMAILGVLGNWFDWASSVGGIILLFVSCPYLVVWMVISTIKEQKKKKALKAKIDEENKNKKG